MRVIENTARGWGAPEARIYHPPTMLPQLCWPLGFPLGPLTLRRFSPMILAWLLDPKVLPTASQNELNTQAKSCTLSVLVLISFSSSFLVHFSFAFRGAPPSIQLLFTVFPWGASFSAESATLPKLIPKNCTKSPPKAPRGAKTGFGPKSTPNPNRNWPPKSTPPKHRKIAPTAPHTETMKTL